MPDTAYTLLRDLVEAMPAPSSRKVTEPWQRALNYVYSRPAATPSATPPAPSDAPADPYEVAARAAGWRNDGGGIFHPDRDGNGTGDDAEYADDWKEACQISGIEPAAADPVKAEMLAALKDAVYQVRDLCRVTGKVMDQAFYDRCEAAIARAEGRV